MALKTSEGKLKNNFIEDNSIRTFRFKTFYIYAFKRKYDFVINHNILSENIEKCTRKDRLRKLSNYNKILILLTVFGF